MVSRDIQSVKDVTHIQLQDISINASHTLDSVSAMFLQFDLSCYYHRGTVRFNLIFVTGMISVHQLFPLICSGYYCQEVP